MKIQSSIHPRQPRLADLGISVPRDKDGAFRAEKRLDGRFVLRQKKSKDDDEEG